MASKKLGTLIKKARTDAGLTQEALAKKIKGLEARDISAAERGEKDLTVDQYKAIAKATGVTQKSLLDLVAGTKSSSTAKKTTTTTKTTKSDSDSDKLTAAEKKLLTAYRKADKDTKSAALGLLTAEENEIIKLMVKFLASQAEAESATKKATSGGSEILKSLLGNAAGFLKNQD
ncbi:MAG: helix-turn-helix transcriptional regulator [Eubacteriales bacterium]|nr:helix-turn-helix transcriptional regulator [Eubacteriales bacterium]